MIHLAWTWLVANILASQNQFLSGGLVLGMIGGLLVYLKSLPHTLWGYFLRTFTIYVEVSSQDAPYRWVLLWLHHQRYTKKARRLALKYTKGETIFVPSKGTHLFWWGHRLMWLTHKDDDNKTAPAESGYMMATRETISFRILGRKRSLVLKILAEAKDLQKTIEDHRLRIYVKDDGNWDMELRQPRPLKTIFMPESASGLLDDIRRFLARKQWYQDVGIPYRRGYLFYGPPGNGKSSTVVGIASELNLPIYVLNLGAVPSDTSLESLVHSIDTGKPAILLIEDIDTAIPDRKVDKSKKPFSLGTLLNLMDGVVAQENLILIVTTNVKDKLDPALIRPGRIDKCIEFTNASATQILAALSAFSLTDTTVHRDLLTKAGTISMAQVQEALVKASQETL